MAEKPIYGGQAVIEGVMMRGPSRMAIAVRTPDNGITVRSEVVSPWARRHPLLKLPIVRGFVTFIETLLVGIDALLYSANQSAGADEELSKTEMSLTVLLGAGLAILIFVIIPTLLLGFLKKSLENLFLVNLIEGLVRIAFLVAYVYGISRMQDIRRVLQYHGAEHKVIHAFENGEPLTVDAARKYTTLHPRCGTSFLLFVVVVATFLFSFLGWPALIPRILSRIALMPVVAGISYELLKLTGRSRTPWLEWATLPGLWLQRFTTLEPDDGMLEVAIAALQVARDGGDGG